MCKCCWLHSNSCSSKSSVYFYLITSALHLLRCLLLINIHRSEAGMVEVQRTFILVWNALSLPGFCSLADLYVMLCCCFWAKWKGLKGASQRSYTPLSFINFGHIGDTNPAHFPQNSFIYAIWCLFTFCPYSINVTESSWKCVTTLVKKNICVKILLHANIPARKAALGRNYFSRRNNFGLHGSRLPSLSLSRSAIFDQINTDVLFRRVNYLYLATFMCPIVFLYPVSTWMAVNGL